jgi:hypothetical protein
MKTVTVTPRELDQTVAYWAGKGLVVTAQTPGSVTLARPRKPPRTFWNAVKWSVLTLGLYPVAIILWWVALAWWVKPIIAANTVNRVTVRVDQPQQQQQYY